MPGLVPGIYVLPIPPRACGGGDLGVDGWTIPAMAGKVFARTVMHDIKWIRDNPGAFDRALARRGLGGEAARLIAIDEHRRATILKVEQAQARRNAASKEIGEAKKSKDEARAASLMAEVAELKTTMPEMEAATKAADEELTKELAAIP